MERFTWLFICATSAIAAVDGMHIIDQSLSISNDRNFGEEQGDDGYLGNVDSDRDVSVEHDGSNDGFEKLADELPSLNNRNIPASAAEYNPLIPQPNTWARRDQYDYARFPYVFKFQRHKTEVNVEANDPDVMPTRDATDSDITHEVTDPDMISISEDSDTYKTYIESTITEDVTTTTGTTITTSGTTLTAPSNHESCMRLTEKETRMTRAQREAVCKQIREGERNAKKPKWTPSARQADWWNSLGENGTVGWDAGTKKVRREYRTLTHPEREAFHQAVLQLKYTMIDNMSKYDIFVFNHQTRVSPEAHWGASFLPFHREFLFRFQRAIHQVDPTVSVPYWDSNMDHHLGDNLAQRTIMWTEDFMGNGHGNVVAGPFKSWVLLTPVDRRRLLHRELYFDPAVAELYSDESVVALTAARTLRNISWCVDPEVESKHGLVHDWVGGVMGHIEDAPGDPIFWLHHGFIDCMWETMRERQRQSLPFVEPTTDYPDDAEAMGVGCDVPTIAVIKKPEDSPFYPTKPMFPFEHLRNIDGLRNDYYDQYLACAPRPTCATYDADCGSPYLFCDVLVYRCAPKLIYGAECSRFSASDPCYKSVCCQGFCRQSCATEDK